jgi:hypothetical protein
LFSRGNSLKREGAINLKARYKTTGSKAEMHSILSEIPYFSVMSI